MANLRVIRSSVIDSKTIKIVFSDYLNSTITINNFEITSQSTGISDSSVISLEISEKELILTTLPLTPLAVYNIRLFSITGAPFTSVNGNYLFEDGKTNVISINGAQNPENLILDKLKSYLRKTPYDTENPGLVKSHLENIANVLYKTLNSIHQLKTDNYISIDVIDEYHKRGAGPYDRLNNEGVYDIVRVGPSVSNFITQGILTLSSFPKEPVTLQGESASESLTGGNSTLVGTFNESICNLANDNITKITSITIIYADATVVDYDIQSYGYLIQDSRYDELASTYVILESNQFKFSDKAIKGGFVIPVVGDSVNVSYEYKDLGTEIDPTSIEVSEIKQAIREVCPPIISVFSLKNNRITDVSGNTIYIRGISFLDPHATPPYSATHPAFITEVIYDANSLPSAVGIYSIDYENGKVYVYGSDTTKDNVGTGPFPPVCTYYYKKQYTENLDYTYDAGLREIVSNPLRELRYKPISIYFNFNQNYVPGVDYEPQAHIEELEERINNRLIGNNTIETLHTPITNVFRIYNETTGEIYKLNRFTDTQIVFNFNNPPNVVKIVAEKANFEQIYNETLLVSEDTTTTLRILKLNLKNSDITNSSQDAIAASFDTSLQFTNNSVFIREAYYYREETLTINLNKLTTVGDYIVDYVNGIIYVCVASSQDYDLGTVSYKTKNILVSFPHILSVLDVYSKIDITSDNKTSYQYNTFTDTTIDLSTYKYSDNWYTTKDPPIPILVSNNLITLPENAISLRAVYETTNLNTTYNPINFAIGSSVNLDVGTLVPVEFITESAVDAFLQVDVLEILANSNIEISSVKYVRRISDSKELYNTVLSDGSFSGYTITLPSDTVGIDSDLVSIGLYVKLADVSPVIADYNYGGLYVDYTSLYDEIIVSYEYGDNVVDFRNSETVNEGDIYYATYKYGALRDALLNNFGSIIAIPELNNFDVDLNRERYRDSLSACLQSFPKGPTKGAINDIAQKISHIKPEIKETLFEEWVLGSSHLYDNEIQGSGTLMKGVFDYGIFFGEGNNLRVPISNHIKLENGTLEFWTIPDWDGYNNNDAKIKFCITANNDITTNIFVGTLGETPDLDSDGCFYLTRFDDGATGFPSNYNTTDGVYIYFDEDDFNWKVIVKDLTVPGGGGGGGGGISGVGYTIGNSLLFGGLRIASSNVFVDQQIILFGGMYFDHI